MSIDQSSSHFDKSNSLFLGNDGLLLNSKSGINRDHSFWIKYWEAFDKNREDKLSLRTIRNLINIEFDGHQDQDHIFNKLKKGAKKKTLYEDLIQNLNSFESLFDDNERYYYEDAVGSVRKFLTECSNLKGLSAAVVNYTTLFSNYESRRLEPAVNLLQQRGINQNKLSEINPDEVRDLVSFRDFSFDGYGAESADYVFEDRDIGLVFDLLGTQVSQFIDDVKYIGPSRETPQFYYYPSRPKTHYEYVGPKGEHFPYSLTASPYAVDDINEELKLMGVQKKLEVIEIKKSSHNIEELFALYLVDKKTKIRSNLVNTGFGFSQILPILAQCSLSSHRGDDAALVPDTILIEQPELHVHPALQAELGDTFIRTAFSAMGSSSHFLIETHSEHLILRILRRIRETTENRLPKNVPPIKPSDVAVLYVEPGENGSEIIEIPITEDGEFAAPWPHGFFAERAKELF